MSESIFLALLNAWAYTLVIPYWYMKRGFSIGLVIWSLFAFSSWFTFFFIQQHLYQVSIHYGVHTVVPYLYLFVILYIFISPFNRLRPFKKNELILNENVFIDYYMLIMIVIQLLSIIIDIPTAIKTLDLSLYSLAATRENVNEGFTGALSWSIPVLSQLKGWLQSPLSNINNGLIIVLIFLYKKQRFLVWIFFFVTILHTLMSAIISVSRGEIFFAFALWFTISLLFVNLLREKGAFKIVTTLVILFIAFAPFAITISFARFGSNYNFFFFKYFGEAMNNFNVLLWDNIEGNTWGSAYFGFFSSYLNGNHYSNAVEKWEFIQRNTNVSGQYFYTFVGGFVLEFGKVIPVIIAIIFNRIISKCIQARRNFHLGVLILLILFIDFYLKGVFVFSWQGQNVVGLLYVIIVYFYCKHEKSFCMIRTKRSIYN